MTQYASQHATGIYARVLQALRLENDLATVAADDLLGRRI